MRQILRETPIHLIRNQRQMNLKKDNFATDYVYPIDENTQLELGYAVILANRIPIIKSLILQWNRNC